MGVGKGLNAFAGAAKTHRSPDAELQHQADVWPLLRGVLRVFARGPTGSFGAAMSGQRVCLQGHILRPRPSMSLRSCSPQ